MSRLETDCFVPTFLELNSRQQVLFSQVMQKLRSLLEEVNVRKPHRINGLFRRLSLYPEAFRPDLVPVCAWYNEGFVPKRHRKDLEFRYLLSYDESGFVMGSSLLQQTKRVIRFTVFQMIDDRRVQLGGLPAFQSELFFTQTAAVHRFNRIRHDSES